MSRDAVRVLSRWSGYCRPCSSEDRPLVLVWSGPDRLRTRLLGPEPGTGTLRLTCSVCGGTDLVGWEDEPEPALAVEEAAVDVAVLPGAPADVAVEVPAVAGEEAAPQAPYDEALAEPAHAAVALDGVALDGVALDGVALDGVALDGVALDGVALAAPEVPAVPVDEPAVGPMLWQPAPPPTEPVADEAGPTADEAVPVAYEPVPTAYEPVPTADEPVPVAYEAVPVEPVEPVEDEPGGLVPEPAPYVPGLSADVAAALRDLAAPSVPAPRSDADLDALELLEG